MKMMLLTDLEGITFKNAIDFIEKNLIVLNECDLLNIDNIAKELNISASYLKSTFKRIKNMTIHTYVTQRRMSLASHDLIETEINISDIAIKYGYELDSFTRCFKKIYSVTPSLYRKNGIITKEFSATRVDYEESIEKELYLVEKCCGNCIFCMGDENGVVCAGRSDLYGEKIEKVIDKFPNGCEEFEYTLSAFIENEKLIENLKEERKKRK